MPTREVTTQLLCGNGHPLPNRDMPRPRRYSGRRTNTDTVLAEIGFAADVERTNAEILPRILTAEGDHGAVMTIKQYRGETIWL